VKDATDAAGGGGGEVADLVVPLLLVRVPSSGVTRDTDGRGFRWFIVAWKSLQTCESHARTLLFVDELSRL
jgi:hypothetical protein